MSLRAQSRRFAVCGAILAALCRAWEPGRLLCKPDLAPPALVRLLARNLFVYLQPHGWRAATRRLRGGAMPDVGQLLVAQFQRILNGFIRALPGLIIGTLVFFVFYYAGKGMAILVSRLATRYGEHRYASPVIARLVRWSVAFLGLLVAFLIAFPNFTGTQLVQLLGIAGLILSFAFRDILENFAAGFFLLWAEPFVVGDQIAVAEYEGTVEEIRTRSTAVRTYDGQRVVIPNADLFTKPVIVHTAFERRRLEYDIGIGYGDDVEQARGLILEAINSVEGVQAEPPPDVIVVSLAEYAVRLRARWWTQSPRNASVLDLRDRVLAAIKQRLIAAGIDLPFPTQQVLFHDQTEETDGDRLRQREGWPAGKGAVPRPRSVRRALSRLGRPVVEEGQVGERDVVEG